MALALLLQQRKEKNSKPGKGEAFGCKFKANFILESSTVRPYGKISGQLLLESPAQILHYGIRVQFEACCTLKFETKLDNRVRTHCKCGNLLEGGHEKNMVDGYLESPVMIDLEPFIKDPAPNDIRPYELQAGTNTYGFNISIPGQILPAPFKNSYGTLVYKLVAYMRSENGTVIQIGEKILRFGGYYNLSKNPDAAKPISLEKSVKRSIFSSRKLVHVTLNMENCGFLPDDLLRFSMRVQNPKCLPYKAGVQLLQKMTYLVGSTKKTTIAIVGSTDTEVDEPESETCWDGSFKVHKGISPTYNIGRGPMITVSHVVQLKVKLDDYNAMKAEHVVFVGTTRDTIETLMASVDNVNLSDRGSSGNVTSASERRSSIASAQSNASATNGSSVSRPPVYAQVAARRMSALETAPPPDYANVTTDAEVEISIPENTDHENANETCALLSSPEEEENENNMNI